MSHCRVLPPGDFNVMSSQSHVPHCRVKEFHPPYYCKTLFFAIFYFLFVFLMQFWLRRVVAFGSSWIHLFYTRVHYHCLGLKNAILMSSAFDLWGTLVKTEAWKLLLWQSCVTRNISSVILCSCLQLFKSSKASKLTILRNSQKWNTVCLMGVCPWWQLSNWPKP